MVSFLPKSNRVNQPASSTTWKGPRKPGPEIAAPAGRPGLSSGAHPGAIEAARVSGQGGVNPNRQPLPGRQGLSTRLPTAPGLRGVPGALAREGSAFAAPAASGNGPELSSRTQQIAPNRVRYFGRTLASFLGPDHTTKTMSSGVQTLVDALQFSPEVQARLGQNSREMPLGPQELRWGLAGRALARLADHNRLPARERDGLEARDPLLAGLNQGLETGPALAALARTDYLKAQAVLMSDSRNQRLFPALKPHQRVRVLDLARDPGSTSAEDPISPGLVAGLLGLRLRILVVGTSGPDGAGEPTVDEEVHGTSTGEDGRSADEVVMVGRGTGGALEPVVRKAVAVDDGSVD